MDNPDLDHNGVLAKQREMLCLKKQRLERIIANLDNMLKGDHDMDFTVFDETELQAMFSDMLQNMNESQKQSFIDHYGSIILTGDILLGIYAIEICMGRES